MTNKKICLIGSSGLIGRNLQKQIRENSNLDDADLVLVDHHAADHPPSDQRDHFVAAESAPEKLAGILGGTTICINLASLIFSDADDPQETLTDYLDVGLCPIHSYFPYLKDSLRQWVQLSSISVYNPKPDGSPFKESDFLEPPNPYGISKLAVERYLLTARKSFDFGVQILRMPDIYGPEPRSPRDQRLFPSLQRAFLYKQETWDIFGTGDEKRDMIHISDACNAIIHCIEEPKEGIWNVGSQVGISTNEIIEILKTETDHSPEFRQIPERVEKNHILESSKFAEDFNFKCQIDFSKGIKEEFKYHQLNQSLS